MRCKSDVKHIVYLENNPIFVNLAIILKLSKLVIRNFSHGLPSSDSSLSRSLPYNWPSWKFIGYGDDHLGIKILCDAIYFTGKSRFIRLSAVSPRKLIPHWKHSERTLVIWPNNVLSQHLLCKILLYQHGSSLGSSVL